MVITLDGLVSFPYAKAARGVRRICKIFITTEGVWNSHTEMRRLLSKNRVCAYLRRVAQTFPYNVYMKCFFGAYIEMSAQPCARHQKRRFWVATLRK